MPVKKKILFLTFYGCTPKYFYFNKKNGSLIKKIADGGSNINIHLISGLIKNKYPVNISTYTNNYQYEAYFKNRPFIKYFAFTSPEFYFGFYNLFLENIWKSIVFPLRLLRLKLQADVLISASDFFPDVLGSYLFKIFNPTTRWVAAYYLDAPKPWSKNNPYRTGFFRYLQGCLYWFVQRFSYLMIKAKADFILVTSEPDVSKFVTVSRPRDRVLIVQGGVDLQPSRAYLKTLPSTSSSLSKKHFDACFVGRFHYQKGVVELIKIWSLVCKKRKNALLAMIGVGGLEPDVRDEIKRLHLENNVVLLGFMTGQEKFNIFKQSKIVVHPATYDSGGMAACEAMAWGLPGVSFDLDALKTYYPKGMLKTPCFDLKLFSQNILILLENKTLYDRVRQDAINWSGEWDWDKRSLSIINQILS